MYARLTAYVSHKTLLFVLCGGVLLAVPLLSFAQGAPNTSQFTPLAGIPFLPSTNYTLPQLLNALYKASIVIGALIAVLKITLAGLKYMATDIAHTKGEAKDDIAGALLGLLILLSTALILKTIFGEVNLNVLQVTPLQTPQPAPAAQTAPSLPSNQAPDTTPGSSREGETLPPTPTAGDCPAFFARINVSCPANKQTFSAAAGCKCQ